MDIKERIAEMRLNINEWLDAIGCDSAYRKDMKDTYKKTIPELDAQTRKVLSLLSEGEPEILGEIMNCIDVLFKKYVCGYKSSDVEICAYQISQIKLQQLTARKGRE